MTLEEKKAKILELVRNKPGIKATELVLDYVSYSFETEGKYADDVITILNDLVECGQLVEVEYVLPDMSWRIKSLYFSAGTKVTLVEAQS